MKTVKLEKGRGHIEFSIDESHLLDIIYGKDTDPLKHEKVVRIIADGIRANSPSDIKNKKIAIIIPDNTRLWARGDIFVPVIVKALLYMGASEESIKIIIALGTHAPIPESRFAQLAGEFCASDIEILNSAVDDRSRLRYLGKTTRGTDVTITSEACDADHIIIFGGILHHMLAGFGGGRKYIMPGIAGYDSIQQNHSLAILKDGSAHPFVAQAHLTGNPVNEDLTEAAEIFLKGKSSCYVAVAANGSGEICHADVGPLKETFLRGCEIVNNVCCVKVPVKGDFALISAGGYRTDGQLYQSTKALFNAVNVVGKGGEILFTAEASEGLGNETFGEALKKYRDNPAALGQKLAESFNMPSYVAFRLMDLLHKYRVTLVSSLGRKDTLELGFDYTDNIDRYVQNLTGRGYIIPFAENILPLSEV